MISGADIHSDGFRSHYQLWALERGKQNTQALPEVYVDLILFTLSYLVPAMKRARKGTLLEDAGEARKKFSPLKIILGALPAFFANREVRS